MFGRTPSPKNEESPFNPTSPYGVAKFDAYWDCKKLSTGYDMFACNGILFNHKSPRCGEIFVTRKITIALVEEDDGRVKKENQDFTSYITFHLN